MICRVCQNENRCSNYVCYRCINTSPKLLLTWRFKLLEVRVIRDKLSKMVNTALEEGLNESMGLTERNGNSLTSVLGLQLKRVQIIKEVRRNNKIKQNIHLMEAQIDKKREKILLMKQLLSEHKNDRVPDLDVLKRRIGEWKSKNDIISTFVTKQQKRKLQQLNKWFGHDEGFTFDDFKLFNLPVFSLQMFKENITNENTITSLRISLQYIEMVTKILYIPVPYSFDSCCDIDINMDYCVGLLTYCCIMICDKLNMFPCSKSPYIDNIKLWLKEYDINEILYYISRGERLHVKREEQEENSDNNKNNFIWTLAMIQEVIDDLCSDDTNGSGTGMRSTKDTVLLSRISSVKGKDAGTVHRPSSHDKRLRYLQTQRLPQATNPNNAAIKRGTDGEKAHPSEKSAKHHSTITAAATNTATTTTATVTTSPPQDRWFVVG